MSRVHEVKNSLIKDMIFHARSVDSDPEKFRTLVMRITKYLIFQAMENMPLVERTVVTPNGTIEDECINGYMPFIVSILRASEPMAFSALELIPNAPVCHIGLARDEETLTPDQYMSLKRTTNEKERWCLITDVAVATAGSTCKVIATLKENGVENIKLLCIFTCPEGIERIRKDHPDVEIYCGVIDEKLLKNGYIYAGCGDAGDRSFGTIPTKRKEEICESTSTQNTDRERSL